ncbi:MAG TPA: hypothetical protein VMP01_29735 [Pirellulaceae bacterium]|nr:hypothetical protein [Pirellulaceae bacterium]
MPLTNQFLVAVVVAGMFAAQAAGQMPLAWKLKAGEKFDLHVEQQTASTVSVVNKTTKTSIEMTLDSHWTVESVEDGTAKIRQTVRRVQMKVQAADTAPLAYDTASPGQPSGAVRDLANAVAPLVDPESSIVMTMNERGEIQSVELSPKLAALLDSAQPASQSLDALLKQPLVTLPAKAVSAGDTWEATRELATPAGKFTQQTEYTLGEPKEAGGTTADAITYSATLTPVAAGKAKIKEQSQTGTVLFDGQAGRFLSGEQSQKLVTETPYREATITVVVESQIKRTLTVR